jgi:uncharacterized protein involved in outer membrane biogenesis
MIRKIFLGVVVILVILIVVAVIVTGFFLGPIVKTGMETVGPKITQVSIKVDAVKVSLWSGSAGVEGLVVGNPEGYQAPQAISVGSAAVGVNPFSVLSDKIVIRSVRVEAPAITFEGNPFGGNNLKTIMKNVNAATKSGGPAATNNAAKTAGKPGKKLEVDDFLITGAKVNFNGVILPLPDIHLTDMGKGGDGITTADLTRRVLDALTTATIKAVGSTITDVGKSAGQAAGKALEKSLGSNVSVFSHGLGGLFKK